MLGEMLLKEVDRGQKGARSALGGGVGCVCVWGGAYVPVVYVEKSILSLLNYLGICVKNSLNYLHMGLFMFFLLCPFDHVLILMS